VIPAVSASWAAVAPGAAVSAATMAAAGPVAGGAADVPGRVSGGVSGALSAAAPAGAGAVFALRVISLFLSSHSQPLFLAGISFPDTTIPLRDRRGKLAGVPIPLT
jgi:hypothetical protein